MKWALLVPLVGVGLLWLWAVDPAESDFYPRCALHWLTGLHCPGCGSTRAAHALLHGNLWDALCFNSLLVIGAPVAAIAVAWRSYQAGRRSLPAVSGWAMLAGLLLFGLMRNVPCFPFNVLAPHRAADATDSRLDGPVQSDTSELTVATQRVGQESGSAARP